MGAPRVLLLGSLPRVVLAVIRSLGRAGIWVEYAATDRERIVSSSRYLRRFHPLPYYASGQSAWQDALLQLLARSEYELLLPCTDWENLLCHVHRDELGKQVRLGIAPRQPLDILLSKAETGRHARSLNVPMPRERLVASAAEAQQAAAELGYPLVLKPLQSFQLDHPGWHQPVVKARDAAELDRHVQKLLPLGLIVAQENFVGVGVGVELLLERGEVLLAFQHQRVHEPLQGGPSSYRKSMALQPELFAASVRLLKSLAYTGVAMVEFKVNTTAERPWVFLEVNPRFWGSLPLTIAAGADFPFAYFQLCTGRRVTPSPRYRTEVYSRNLPADLGWLSKNLKADRQDKTLQTKPWRRVLADAVGNWLDGREHLDAWSSDDPRPGLTELLSLAFRALGIRRQ